MIIDRAGHVVWYRDDTPAPWGDFQKQPDGTYTIALYQSHFWA